MMGTAVIVRHARRDAARRSSSSRCSFVVIERLAHRGAKHAAPAAAPTAVGAPRRRRARVSALRGSQRPRSRPRARRRGCALGPELRAPRAAYDPRPSAASRGRGERLARGPALVGGLRGSRAAARWSARRSRTTGICARPPRASSRRATSRPSRAASSSRRWATRSMPPPATTPSSVLRRRGRGEQDAFFGAINLALGDRRLGPPAALQRGGPGAAVRDRGVPARRRALPGLGRRAGLLRAARARPRARDRARDGRDLHRRRSTSWSASIAAASPPISIPCAPRRRSAQAAASVPDLERRIVAKENQLSVLVGPPAGTDRARHRAGRRVAAARGPAGVPARAPAAPPGPDRGRAGAGGATNARWGVEVADFLPRIGLTAFARGGQPGARRRASIRGTGLWSSGGLRRRLAPLFGRKLYATARSRRPPTRLDRERYEQAHGPGRAPGGLRTPLVARQKLEGVRRAGAGAR